jgi:hypothetical protein
MVIEWFGRMNLHALEGLGARWPRAIRYAFYYFLLASIYWFAGAEQQFIYFQF